MKMNVNEAFKATCPLKLRYELLRDQGCIAHHCAAWRWAEADVPAKQAQFVMAFDKRLEQLEQLKQEEKLGLPRARDFQDMDQGAYLKALVDWASRNAPSDDQHPGDDWELVEPVVNKKTLIPGWRFERPHPRRDDRKGYCGLAGRPEFS